MLLRPDASSRQLRHIHEISRNFPSSKTLLPACVIYFHRFPADRWRLKIFRSRERNDIFRSMKESNARRLFTAIIVAGFIDENSSSSRTRETGKLLRREKSRSLDSH